DYQNDISKLKAIKSANIVIGKPSEEIFLCPICNNDLSLPDIKHEHNIAEEDKVNHEVNTLVRRIREIDLLINSERDQHHQFTFKLNDLFDEQLRTRRMLDEESRSMITPYLSERDGLASELATVRQKSKQLHHSLKIRNQQKSIGEYIDDLTNRIDALNVKLESLKESAPSMTEVLNNLGKKLDAYLKKVKIKDRLEVGIDETSMLPTLRQRLYKDITSGGLRTILSIGYFLSLLEYAVENNTNLPAFLMIDTVGKYLGKTQTQYNETDKNQDKAEEISDPSKYNNMYEHIIDIAEFAEMNDVRCQMILVDNDVPAGIQEKYSGFVVAHYSSEGRNNLPLGLIDDAIPLKSS
ncbi:MAG TPA: hypothetical protein VN114_08955, partial [Oxalicibacterium sp.]|uniref:DUF3732 domain-containing protein n=1 Tax=Oxalicibacterium sp. TaxID=2766525 RepID=UPI002CBA875E